MKFQSEAELEAWLAEHWWSLRKAARLDGCGLPTYSRTRQGLRFSQLPIPGSSACGGTGKVDLAELSLVTSFTTPSKPASRRLTLIELKNEPATVADYAQLSRYVGAAAECTNWPPFACAEECVQGALWAPALSSGLRSLLQARNWADDYATSVHLFDLDPMTGFRMRSAESTFDGAGPDLDAARSFREDLLKDWPAPLVEEAAE